MKPTLSDINGRVSFKTPQVFPYLKNLVGVENSNDAWKKIYPYHLLELPLKAVINTDNGEQSTPIEAYKAIIRDDGQQIAVVRNTYTVVQPQDILAQFDPFIESGLVDLNCGGSLKNGTRISMVGKIRGSDREIVKGEEIASYLNFYAGLDGSLSIGADYFGLQLRCLNGLCTVNSKLNISIRHTKSVHERLESAQSIIAKAIKSFEKTTEIYTQLALKPMTREVQETYIRNVFETKKSETPTDETEELSTRQENKLDRVIELLDTQKGLELVPVVRGTAWQAYSAVTEYLTYEHGRNDDSRLNSQLFGESNRLNQKALNLALTM